MFKYNPITGQLDMYNTSAGSGTGISAQEFTGDGSTTAFTVTEFTLNDDYQVIVSGVVQQSGHSRSGNVITFTTAPNNGAPITILN